MAWLVGLERGWTGWLVWLASSFGDKGAGKENWLVWFAGLLIWLAGLFERQSGVGTVWLAGPRGGRGRVGWLV